MAVFDALQQTGGMLLVCTTSCFMILTCREVYDAAQAGYKGRCTAPLLIDKKQKKLVSNESSDIMRMLNSVQLPGCTDVDLYPQQLQSEIGEINDLVYDKVRLVVTAPVLKIRLQLLFL